MLRQLRARCHNPAHSLTSSLFRSPRPQQRLSWQRHFSSRSGATRHSQRSHHDPGNSHGSRNNHHHHHHNGKGPRQLHAGIYGTIYLQIGYMVCNEELDWKTRSLVAIGAVQNIMSEPDVIGKWSKFYETCELILGAYSGGEVEYHEGAVRIPAGVSWAASDRQIRIMTAPDPEVEGGTLLLCLVALDESKEDVYIASHGDSDLYTDVALDMIPEVEAFARRLPLSPKVRGGMVVLDPAGSWKSLYWDGRRWINLVYLDFM